MPQIVSHALVQEHRHHEFVTEASTLSIPAEQDWPHELQCAKSFGNGMHLVNEGIFLEQGELFALYRQVAGVIIVKVFND